MRFWKNKRVLQVRTLDVRLEVVLGRLEAILGLEPDETELILDIVDHGGLSLTTLIISSILGGGVGSLELEILAATLQVLAAVTLPEDGKFLVGDKVEGVGDDLVAGNDILVGIVSLYS
jgi:hypothetical protein